MNSVVEENDRILMARLIRADEEAFGQFFDLVFQPLEESAAARELRAPEVEQLVTATLLEAVRSLDTWRGQTPLVTWVRSIQEAKATEWSAGGLAGENPDVAASPSRERVRATVHAEWQAVTTRRAQRRVVTSVMFATVVAFVILLFNCPPG